MEINFEFVAAATPKALNFDNPVQIRLSSFFLPKEQLSPNYLH